MRKTKPSPARQSSLSVVALALLAMATAACSSFPLADLDPESRSFFETARYIMSKEEISIFQHLPDQGARIEFIREFWEKRDPDPDTEINEFKAEFERRVDYANARFREGIPGWKTDRGRIYIYFGEPDKIDRNPVLSRPDIKGLQIWIYYRYNFAVRFIDKDGTGSYVFDPYSDLLGDFFQAVERVRLGMTPRSAEEMPQKFLDFKITFDDRKNSVILSLPVEDLVFYEDSGQLKLDLDCRFFIYAKKGTWKQRFSREVRFAATEAEITKQEEVTFVFPLEIPPGRYYLDVTLQDRRDPEKARKIVEISVNSK